MNLVETKKITFPVLLAFITLANVLSLPVLFTHNSTGDTAFGQYSTRYVVVLLVALVLTIFWGCTWIFRHKIEAWNQKIPTGWCILGIMFVLFASLVAMFFPFEQHVLEYIGINGMFAIAVLAFPMMDRYRMTRMWLIILVVSVAIFVFFVLISNLTQRPFHPDDAHWADMSTTVWLKDGLYARTWRDEPIKVEPGLGLVAGIYGWTLLNVDFDLRVGRLIRFSANILTALGMALLMGQVYGRRVAYLTGLIALTSFFIVADGSYRPNALVTVANLFLMTMILKAREANGWRAYTLHFFVGLVATLSMEFHALALGFALGASIYYLADFVWRGRNGDWSYWQMLVTFGSGALLGTLIYYFANIALVGGLDVYLQKLVGERYVSTRSFDWLNPPLFERTLILAGWAYLFWRRSGRDRLFIAMFAAVFLATVFVDAPGYLPHTMALLLIPAAVPILDGFSQDTALTKRFFYIAGSILIIMATWLGQAHIQWDSIRYLLSTGSLPRPEIYDIGDAIVPYVGKDEVIATTHELIWTFYDYPNLTSYAAEARLQRYADYDEPALVWEEIDPDVIVDLPQRIATPPGLAKYRETFFTECQRLNVRANAIVIYRRDCEETPELDDNG